MEGYKSMLKRLNSLIDALEKGALSVDELVELEEITRNLHERSIILRYTAFKERVLSNEPEEALVEEVEVPQTIVPEPASELEPEEETPFDFSIFEDDTAEEDTTALAEMSLNLEDDADAPVAEIETVEEAPAPEPEPEPVKEVIPEPVVEAPKVEEKVPETVASEGDNSFLDRLKLPDNAIAGRFGATKLQSLIGAFGLNERLRYINDLFDGSSELFSEAIKTLDGQNDLKSARLKAAFFADKYSWDPEEEVVIEFMTYLNRRYA